MPQVKKICVDSRFANPLSKSSTDFKIDLTDSIARQHRGHHHRHLRASHLV